MPIKCKYKSCNGFVFIGCEIESNAFYVSYMLPEMLHKFLVGGFRKKIKKNSLIMFHSIRIL